MEINNLPTFLHYFKRIHQRTLRVINTIPEDHFDFRPSDTAFTLQELIIHIANINIEMYGSTIRGKESTYSGHYSDGIDNPKQYYIDSYHQLVDILQDLTDKDLQAKISTPAGVAITCWK